MTMPASNNPEGPQLFEEGAATEGPPDDPTTPFPGLPPGVHPMDPSGIGAQDPVAAKPDTYGSRAPGVGQKPWRQDNQDALPVYQRGDETWSGNLVVVDANSGGTAIAIGRQKGRTQVTLWVPTFVWIGGVKTATSAGVYIAPTEAEVQNALSDIALNPGDSVSIPTEGPVWLGLLPGQATGYCNVMATFNPLGPGAPL